MQNKQQSKAKSLNPPAKRVPIKQAIDLRFPTFEGLVTKISANLSTTGMFVQTTTPAEVGSEFSFRIHIEEWSPIQGDARVVWVRKKTEGPERPAGMGVEFINLDGQSRRMIRWLVDKHQQEGGTPFDLAKMPAGASRVASSDSNQRAKQLASGRPGRSLSLPSILIVFLILGAAAAGGYFWWLQTSDNKVVPPPTITTESEPSDESTDPTEEVESDPQAGISAAVVESDPAGVSRLVSAWTAAWKDRRPEDLLGLYAEDFAPSGSRSRAEWEAAIRDRLDRPGFILVAFSGRYVRLSDLDRATAPFYRSIRSASSTQTGRVILDLVARDGTWLITRETELD